jgi:hypothetical protein
MKKPVGKIIGAVLIPFGTLWRLFVSPYSRPMNKLSRYRGIVTFQTVFWEAD